VDRPRVILHADMDAFYAAIEQRDDPGLRGRPVIVGGSSERGVVAAASYEARRFGVHSAMPSALARRLCPDAVFVRGSMAKYASESKKIFRIFGRFTPVVEGLSLDEAFLDLTGTQRLLGPPREVGARLRAEVRAATGLAVSVGIAPVKLVAKIASDLAKPDGLLAVEPGGLRAFLDPLPVSRIWGVGPVAEARLRRAGFAVIGDLARAGDRELERRLGEWGVGFARLARAEDLREVEPWRDPVSMSEENTFERDVADRAALEDAILAHAEAVARRLRRSGWRARTVVLKLKLGGRVRAGPRGFPLLTRRATLAEPTDDGVVLARTARSLLARERRLPPVRLLGVGTTNLLPAEGGQLPLFEAPAAARRKRLNRALDELSDRFGSRAVVRGSVATPDRAGLSLQIKRGEEPEASREKERR
jgi:DNA polymerase-4